VADRDALDALVGSIEPDHPLTAVIHSAGIQDNATIEALAVDQVEGVLRPKVDAALNLHELTKTGLRAADEPRDRSLREVGRLAMRGRHAGAGHHHEPRIVTAAAEIRWPYLGRNRWPLTECFGCTYRASVPT
jgi:hypothetical protein